MCGGGGAVWVGGEGCFRLQLWSQSDGTTTVSVTGGRESGGWGGGGGEGGEVEGARGGGGWEGGVYITHHRGFAFQSGWVAIGFHLV